VTGQSSGSRLWLAGGSVVAALIVLASWFLVIGPVRADTQTLREDTDAVDTRNVALQATLADLKEVDTHRDDLIAEVQKSLAALPPDVSLPDFNRQILDQAASRGVELVNITVGAASSPVASGAATSPTTPATGQLTVPVTLQTKGPVLAQLYFLRDLQEVGPRLALVTSTAFATDDDPTGEADAFVLTTQLSVFASSLTDSDREQLAEVLGDDLTG
jgi:hypothetical protein